MVVSAPLGLDSGQGYVLHPHNFKQHTFRDNQKREKYTCSPQEFD